MKQIQNDDHRSAIELFELLETAYKLHIDDTDPEKAAEVADALTTGLRELYGADDLYIPSRNLKSRNRAIVRDYTGVNVPELAKKHNLSERHIARIVAQGSIHD